MRIWRLIGIILQGIGSIRKRSDTLFLGYYLAGTGKKRSLPEYQNEAILKECNQSAHYWEHDLSDTYIVHTFHENHLYTTIGKAWVRRANHLIYIMDTYKFYPLCRDADYHFSDCPCTSKAYANLYRDITIPEKISKLPILKKIRLDKKFGKYIRILYGWPVLGYEISDEFWVNKGKPFEIYSEIPVNKI